ncbi:MAG: monovalent cation/H(+) antiporter subunit G [Armatimonadota bacterium]|nr:monovalent cation/H(+) antiporter subunit G [Armatimonadota bacterium]MDR7421919.1 monovalent cation/H(+) antiporter subunit G [Armatimonadota bacterium]MDR7454448.1 monovalent cation/H(+) antiporter subunit G [Armatimonadota bacterium]MDR7457214.1 monovalent cation/H(+) antiporter subunit G [Armatimonadota bacterium]MDR7497283.1 monovalent cation/H(+) antiporter subunit G [Armatimonadota bacterium]
MRESLVAAMLLLGAALSLVAALGLHRFADAYARLHAATKAATLGLMLTLAAAILAHGTDGREVATLLFVFMTSPVSAHMVAKAMYETGYRPWEEAAKPARRRRR